MDMDAHVDVNANLDADVDMGACVDVAVINVCGYGCTCGYACFGGQGDEGVFECGCMCLWILMYMHGCVYYGWRKLEKI